MRIVNRLLAFVVALALVGVGVIIVVEVIAARSGSDPLIIHWHAILAWAHRNTWKDASVVLASAITAAAGLLLLLPQLFRRRVTRLRIDAGTTTDAAISRKGVMVTIRSAVAEVDGVASSRVKVGRRRIRVRALSTALEGEVIGELQPKVTEAVAQQLEELRLHKARRFRVAINGRSSSANRSAASDAR
ncbi:MAG: hypothetical protein JWN96_2660 [Mycobacterium sp.]|jgi:hypothetical protein|nr:hypothetical protein [Mycobacterium sp.]